MTAPASQRSNIANACSRAAARMDLALRHDILCESARRPRGARPLCPRRDPLDVDLGMELDGEVRAEAEGRRPRGGLGQLETARRHAHLLGVPHEPRAARHQATVDRLDREPADLGPVEHVDARHRARATGPARRSTARARARRRRPPRAARRSPPEPTRGSEDAAECWDPSETTNEKSVGVTEASSPAWCTTYGSPRASSHSATRAGGPSRPCWKISAGFEVKAQITVAPASRPPSDPTTPALGWHTQ